MKVMKLFGDFHSITDLLLEEKCDFSGDTISHQFPIEFSIPETEPSDTLSSNDFVETLFASGEEDDSETSSPRSDNSVQFPITETMTEPWSPTNDNEQKELVRSHLLFPCFFQFVASFKQTTMAPPSKLHRPPYLNPSVFPLEELIAPEIVAIRLDPDQRTTFLQNCERIEQRYKQEHLKLSKTCYDHTVVMFDLLKAQSTIRPILDEEIQSKTQAIQDKFDVVKKELRQQVYRAILTLYKVAKQHQKQKRSLIPKSALARKRKHTKQ
eukprot:TRINITY_DN17324_c0_g1_i1.p1 TRINITY_DN17324_c0_g1~~TRINITY_DN17324_c0_g1_i1.p1  ORF type:complete len:268 (-),score=47.38 TRINITY_DN17324_c0_g1_i1:60-863(-)